MSIRRFSTYWNKEKLEFLVGLSFHADLANNGNKKSQRKIKELKDYIFTDDKNFTIAERYDISVSQFEKDMKYWKNLYNENKAKYTMLRDEDIVYRDITGVFMVYVPKYNRHINIELFDFYDSLDIIRVNVRQKISEELNIDFVETETIEFELNLKWVTDVHKNIT